MGIQSEAASKVLPPMRHVTLQGVIDILGTSPEAASSEILSSLWFLVLSLVAGVPFGCAEIFFVDDIAELAINRTS